MKMSGNVNARFDTYPKHVQLRMQALFTDGFALPSSEAPAAARCLIC
ncbi:MAG: hypothetical protein ACI82A_001537 [Candidatus Azotimanducaceae bacterium]|jgi:hypothetical protein